MERFAIRVRGTVQGVGFRPFVYALAARLRLSGFVKNQTGSVLIQVEGERSSLEQFVEELQTRPPPLSSIEEVHWWRHTLVGERRFRIEPSDADSSKSIFVSPDVATCEDCLAELLDPADRRYRYPFINCTNCGPRLTIIEGVPYDRERTSMRPFPLCQACRAEYEDPNNRRFHAEATACPNCGPRLAALNGRSEPIEIQDPLGLFVEAVRRGEIGALKGLGGFHLVCDATSTKAVGELRRRKHRDEKPFAVMVRHTVAAERLCHVNADERLLIESPRRPIALLQKRARPAIGVSEAVAPGNPCLGIMLPYTPLHHLLMEAMGETPLVMTSGNRSDEPIAYTDFDAVERLAGIADLFLTHDRTIRVRCDDSVTTVVGGTELPVRRSRGYAPAALDLPVACPRPVLAVGGQLKAVFALGRGRHAILSHHLGDLDHFQAYRAFEQDIRLYEQLMQVRPELIVHDLHPDYLSTTYAHKRAADERIQRLAVQHHHAHMASCMAENGLVEPVIGVTFDGTGYGTDGAVWGGEFLIGDYRGFQRAAHLRYVGMAGGDHAIREPWRMALAHLIDAGCDAALLAGRVSPAALRTVRSMLERRWNSPATSSVGRLFDAVAALSGVRDRVTYEGQAAIELEWLAQNAQPDGSYPFQVIEESPANDSEPILVVDTRPIVCAVAEDVTRKTGSNRVARRFHSTLVELVTTVCGRIRRSTGLDTVVLSGGVFANALLTSEVAARLASDDFRVHRHRRVPPNDGGVSLGQLAVAAAREGQIANDIAKSTCIPVL